MASTVGFTCVNPVGCPCRPRDTPSVLFPKSGLAFHNPSFRSPPPTIGTHSSSFRSLRVQAKAPDSSNRGTKPNSIVCADCDGNGAILCSQCKGTGVNSVDHFNGQFKAGGLCWLCRGKRDILCGNCNGAGFVGGFLSTFDE